MGNIADRWSDYFPGSDSPGCGMGPEGIKWLRRTLAADTTTFKVLVQHFPFLYDSVETQCGYMLIRGDPKNNFPFLSSHFPRTHLAGSARLVGWRPIGMGARRFEISRTTAENRTSGWVIRPGTGDGLPIRG